MTRDMVNVYQLTWYGIAFNLFFVCDFYLHFMFEYVGRSKNVWESPKGCLMFSFTIQMEDGRIVPLLQYVVSLAVTEAIKDICDRNVS